MADAQEIDVLHLIGTLSPGGAERNLYYLAPHLSRSKLRYGICCLIDRGEYADEVEALGVPTFELGYRKRYLIPTVLRLARLLRQRKVKILHTHLFEPGLVGRLAAWGARTPVRITHEHGKTLWKSWYHRMFERLAMHATDLRIAVSRDISDLRVRTEHTPASKIRVVFNAVDPTRFEIDRAARDSKRSELGLGDFFVIGTIGRLIEAKSYDLLLEVAHEVCRKMPDARFVVVGDGPLAGDLERIRESLDLVEKVRFLGKRGDIPEILASFDVYIVTSRREGLPVALIEAMMAAKPIISTDVGGIPDTLSHGESGILVEAGSRDALVREVVSLAGDADRMRDLGAKARKSAIERYAPVKVLGELEEIYTEMLSRKGIPTGTP